MAVNPNIALQVRAPDIGAAFSNSLLNLQRLDQIGRMKAEAPLRNRLLQANAQTAEANVPTDQKIFSDRQNEIITSLGVAAQQIIPDLQAGRTEQVIAKLQRRRNDLVNANLPTDETDEAIQLAQTNPAELLTVSQQAVDLAKKIRPGGKAQFGGQQTFKDENNKLFFGTTRRDPATGAVESILAPIGGGTEQPTGKVSLVSGLGQTAQEKLTADITKAEGKEEAEQKVKLKFKPKIEKAVIAARTEAKNKGETFGELNQAKAALPNLKLAVDELRELSKIATSTLGGKLFDAAVKETGFGSTKGATARAKFIAIVNNQVLPLLKPTFGAAFTVPEGESLKATMGDPDASPDEKMVQLDAFITQKMRDIETKEAQLNPQQEVQQQVGTQQPGVQPKFLGFE